MGQGLLVYGMQFAICNQSMMSNLDYEVELVTSEFTRRTRHGTDSSF
jgi:hypothetical protein